MATANTLEKLGTGIDGLDAISEGGLPKRKTTLVAGSAGSGKTILAAQFLAEGIRQKGESGVFVTFEEPAQTIRDNLISLGWDIAKWEDEGRWIFVDASAQVEEETTLIVGSYDMGALLSRVENAIKNAGATRVSLDSLGAVFTRFDDSRTVRNELFRVSTLLRRLEVTSIMTVERMHEYGPISREGVEEFVADNVIILRNVLEDENRRRTAEILKFRGATHKKGEFPFTILPDQGLVVVPLSEIYLEYKATDIRIKSRNEKLDKMCGGGFNRDSVVLVSGATGTGKTLMVTEFIAGGIGNNERCLLFAFEESREQFFRNAAGWGVDLRPMEESGYLKVVCEYPEVSGLEERLINMREIMDDFRPHRVAVDSLSALERVSTQKSFREFVLAITFYLRQMETTGMITSTSPTLLGVESVTEAHISTLADSIILLRYVEIFGVMRRALTVLKMRGSQHDKNIREFTIDGQGMHIGEPFKNVVGILAGKASHYESAEMSRQGGMFKEDE